MSDEYTELLDRIKRSKDIMDKMFSKNKRLYADMYDDGYLDGLEFGINLLENILEDTK